MKCISQKAGKPLTRTSNEQTASSKMKSYSKPSPARTSRKKASPDRKKYRYVVKVVETVEYSTAIESDKKMPWCALEKIAESRRIKGELSFLGVKDVDSWCDEAFVDGTLVEKKP